MKRPAQLRRKALSFAKNVAVVAATGSVIVADAAFSRAQSAIRRRLAKRRQAIGAKKIISSQGG